MKINWTKKEIPIEKDWNVEIKRLEEELFQAKLMAGKYTSANSGYNTWMRSTPVVTTNTNYPMASGVTALLGGTGSVTVTNNTQGPIDFWGTTSASMPLYNLSTFGKSNKIN